MSDHEPIGGEVEDWEWIDLPDGKADLSVKFVDGRRRLFTNVKIEGAVETERWLRDTAHAKISFPGGPSDFPEPKPCP
jgi:hypothetical protein